MTVCLLLWMTLAMNFDLLLQNFNIAALFCDNVNPASLSSDNSYHK